jgi:ArsR family transcriptional regulator
MAKSKAPEAPTLKTFGPASRVLMALADPGRLLILRALADSDGPQVVTDLVAAAAPLSQPTVSHHISVLAGAGLIDKEKVGTFVYCSINADGIRAIAGLLNAFID